MQMLSSKDILERTGISRATLNNYISAGLVPRPEVLPPNPQDGGAPRIGYFPDDTIERIETIQRLKREGWSLGRILDFFSGKTLPATPAPSLALDRGVDLPVADSPSIMVVAVLALTLHDADGLWVALSVHDYFALANEVAGDVRREIAKRQGDVLRVAPHRFVCRFLPRPGGDHLWNALEASLSLREAVREISGRWKLRRNWDWDIELDAGLCDGESWVSTTPPDDVQIVGETMGDAEEMSRWARRGSILVTRSYIARLPETLRSRIVHGVPEPRQHEGSPARPMTFARLRDIAPSGGLPRRIASLPVTEIVEVRADAAPAEPKELP
jgi:hypothetical protein